MNAVVWGIGLYVLAQLAVGFIVSRYIRSEDDYLVAGRRLGYGLATFSIFATWFGAETCIGATGTIYEDGLDGGSADPFGYGLCLVLMGLVFARPLWRRKLTTFGDLFRQRFGIGVERLAVVIMIPTSLLWAAAQVRAFGQVLTAATSIQIGATITLAAGVVVVYTVAGGLLADAWTDLIQGGVLVVGLVVLAVLMFGDVGIAALGEVEPARLALFDSPNWMAIAESWAIPVCGSVLAAELVARVVASRSAQVAQRSALMAAGIYLAIGIIPVSVGLLGPRIVGEVEPEQVLPMVAAHYMPGVLYILFAGALVSAILSTVDSCLLVAASLTSHNLIVPVMHRLETRRRAAVGLLGATADETTPSGARAVGPGDEPPTISERTKLLIARAFVVIYGIAAYVLALSAQSVYGLVEEASSFGSAGIFVVAVAALFVPWGGRAAAFATLVTGLVTWTLAAYLLPASEIDAGPMTEYPYLTSLASALLAYAAVATITAHGNSPSLPLTTKN